MPRTTFDENILDKLSRKSGHSRKYVVEEISKRASRLSISSEAALILWAKQFGIGTSSFQRKLPPHIQQQIQNNLPSVFGQTTQAPNKGVGPKLRKRTSQVDVTSAAIEFLLTDPELRSRCADLIRARGNFDRVFREATTVLDDRLKKLAGLKKVNPSELATKVLHPNNPILQITPDKDEQQGFFFVSQGIFLAFRNPIHHQLSNQFTRQHALKFGGFIDFLLSIFEQAKPTVNGKN